MLMSYFVSGPLAQAEASAERPPSLFETAVAYTRGLGCTRLGYLRGLGAALTDFEAFLAKAEARAKAEFSDGTVFCKVPDASGSFRLECKLIAGKGPVIAMQKASDLLLNQIPLFNLSGQTLEVRLPDGGTRPVFIEKFPENPIFKIGGAYDGVVGGGTMGFASPAMLLAASLKTPPPDVVPAFASPTALTFARHAEAIAAYFSDVTNNFNRLLADFKARGGKPAATPLIPETVVVVPGSRAAAIPVRKKFPTVAVASMAVVTAGLIGLAAWGASRKAKGGKTLLPESIF
jgi:hypothetical protein